MSMSSWFPAFLPEAYCALKKLFGFWCASILTSMRDLTKLWMDYLWALFFMVYLSIRDMMHFFRILSVMTSWDKERSLSKTGKISS